MSTVTEPLAATPTNGHGQQLAHRPSPMAQMSLGERGIVLRNLDELLRFAQLVVDAGMACKGDTFQSVAIKIQMGAELGLPAMASIQNVAVINGRPSIWGAAMLGVVRASGLFDEEAFTEIWVNDPKEGLACISTVRRKDGKVFSRQFSQQDAKQAGLLAKEGPHHTYPKRMMQMRARSWALNDGFSDVLRGMRTAEEVMEDVIDIPPRDTPQNAMANKPPNALGDLTAKMSASKRKPALEAPAGGNVVELDDGPKFVPDFEHAEPQKPVKAPTAAQEAPKTSAPAETPRKEPEAASDAPASAQTESREAGDEPEEDFSPENRRPIVDEYVTTLLSVKTKKAVENILRTANNDKMLTAAENRFIHQEAQRILEGVPKGQKSMLP